MKHLAIVVDWYGPYTREAIYDSIGDFTQGLYIATGNQKGKHGSHKLQYVGISTNFKKRLFNHETLNKVTRSFSMWLGEVATYAPSGRKKKWTSESLDYAEWAHSYYLNFELNDKKTVNPPDRPVTVLNRWWRDDYKTRRVHRPHPGWADIIDHIGPGEETRVVWFGGRQQRFKAK